VVDVVIYLCSSGGRNSSGRSDGFFFFKSLSLSLYRRRKETRKKKKRERERKKNVGFIYTFFPFMITDLEQSAHKRLTLFFSLYDALSICYPFHLVHQVSNSYKKKKMLKRRILYLTSRLALQRIPNIVKHDIEHARKAVAPYPIDVSAWEDLEENNPFSASSEAEVTSATTRGQTINPFSASSEAEVTSATTRGQTINEIKKCEITNSTPWSAVWPRPWFYHEQSNRFRRFIESPPTLLDPNVCTWLQRRKTLLWNMDKTYLFDLYQHGVNIIPSQFIFHPLKLHNYDILTAKIDRMTRELGWSDILIKPSIGANSYRTQKIYWPKKEDQVRAIDLVSKIIQDSHVLIQPVEKDLAKFGELNLVYVRDQFMFAVKKVVRTQEDGVIRPAAETLDMAETQHLSQNHPFRQFADHVLKVSKRVTNESLPLVSRVDIVANPDNIRLVELEQLEPYLFWENSSNDMMCSKVKQAIDEILLERKRH
jgi:hypothetical protein